LLVCKRGKRQPPSHRSSRVARNHALSTIAASTILSIISVISWYRARISETRETFEMYKHVPAWGTADQRTTLARTVKVNPLARLRNIVPGFSRNERMIYSSLARNRGEAAAKQRRSSGGALVNSINPGRKFNPKWP